MNNNKIWEGFLSAIKANTSDLTYKTWFLPLSLHKIDEVAGIIYLAADNDVQLKYIENNFMPTIENIFDRLIGKAENDRPYRIVVKLKDAYIEKPSSRSKKNKLSQEKLFNPKYNFDNFVVGACNRFAHAAAVAVAENPGEAYNPLFIYGGSGLGKTHLMQAMGVHIGKKFPEKNVLYVSSEMFTNEFVTSLRDNNINKFEKKYRNVDVLLIDDIQFIEDKDRTQEEFFYTFESLYNNNKQIVITADCPPNNLKGIEERLRTRFAWNMIADIQPPDYETRIAILLKLAEKSKIEMTDDLYDICCLIAEQVNDNIRELEGALNRVIVFSELLHEPITIENAKETLKDIIHDNMNSIEPERIKHVVASHYKIKVADLDSKKRNAEINFPRQVAMYICRNTTDLSNAKIGALFGGRHYSTVMHAVEKIENELKTDTNLVKDIEAINKTLNSKNKK